MPSFGESRVTFGHFSWRAAQRILLLPCVFTVLLSCTTTSDIVTWTDTNYSNGPLKKIVVLGVFRNLNSRIAFENEIAKKLNETTGTKAVSSLEFLTPGVKYNHKEFEEVFAQNGFDGVLLVRSKSVQNKTSYVPEKNQLVQHYQRVGGSLYHNVYLVTWKNVREPGYFKDNYIVSIEASLFLNQSDKMIWTLEKNTQTSYRAEEGITSPKKESKEIANEVAGKLKKAKLLLSKK